MRAGMTSDFYIVSCLILFQDVNEFVESWATHECLPTNELTDECMKEVEDRRRPWAESACSVMYEEAFSLCHEYVSECSLKCAD